jgi:sialic acid synthase SpsE
MADADLTIIAEAGVNHNGDIGMARELVHAAAEAGADVVKFQSFSAEDLATAGATTAPYQERNTGSSSQRELLKSLELDIEVFAELAGECRKHNVEFLCTAFDSATLPELIRLGMRSIKIASGELTNVPALEFAAKQNRPILLSTGMATLEEVGGALQVIAETAPVPVTILHCTSLYPAPPATLNLRAISTLQVAFGLPVGYSDHSLGEQAAIAAVALGATVIEKHFTLDATLPGPDHSCSLEPAAFRAMVTHLREVHSAMGDGVKKPSREEMDTAKLVRRSWHAKHSMAAGHRIQSGDIALMRPDEGMAPANSPIGRILAIARRATDPIREQDLA